MKYLWKIARFFLLFASLSVIEFDAFVADSEKKKIRLTRRSRSNRAWNDLEISKETDDKKLAPIEQESKRSSPENSTGFPGSFIDNGQDFAFRKH